jgi:hypothetical protein
MWTERLGSSSTRVWRNQSVVTAVGRLHSKAVLWHVVCRCACNICIAVHGCDEQGCNRHGIISRQVHGLGMW